MSPTRFSGYGPAGSHYTASSSTSASAPEAVPHPAGGIQRRHRWRAGDSDIADLGPNRDWLKNITAAGGGRMQRHGKTFGVARLPFEEAVLLTRSS
jgi:hypothetical protein